MGDLGSEIGGQLASFAALLNLLVSQLLGARLDQLMIADFEFGHDGIERLRAVVAFLGGVFHSG